MPSTTFQIPKKLVIKKETNAARGVFVLEPLERGYGTTIGNSIRRVLLSSLEGYAITHIKISGVKHEFSTIPGVVEDVSELILNLKQVRFKKKAKLVEDKLRVVIKNTEKVQAKDIADSTTTFGILNPDQVICHTDPTADFVLELTIGKGRGYAPAEEQQQHDSTESDAISVDAIFTPIKKASFRVEQPRIAENYERLLLDVETDGTITPKKALKNAAELLNKHLAVFTGQRSEDDQPGEEEAFLATRALLRKTIEELNLPSRAYNCLKANNIHRLGNLVAMSRSDIMKFRNFGEKSLRDLEELVATNKLYFGMDVSSYGIDLKK